MEPKIKYEKIIKLINESERPVVFINGLTHGDERVGKNVIDEIVKLKNKSGTIITNIANEKAFEENVRFIKNDLNRITPGNIDGDYENQVAYYISKIAGMVDVFIDIHSTESSLRNAIIVRSLSDETRKIIDVINPETVLIMKVTGDRVLLSKAKIGIAFEYGNDNDEEATNRVVSDIKKILVHLGMIKGIISNKTFETKIFSVEKFFKKEVGDILVDNVSNLKLVRKGEIVVISKNGDKKLAEEDFYPVLFSQNGYEDIFGFVGFEY